MTRSVGTYEAGTKGCCLFTTTQILAGSVLEWAVLSKELLFCGVVVNWLAEGADTVGRRTYQTVPPLSKTRTIITISFFT